jgi:hypothetical protein
MEVHMLVHDPVIEDDEKTLEIVDGEVVLLERSRSWRSVAVEIEGGEASPRHVMEWFLVSAIKWCFFFSLSH